MVAKRKAAGRKRKTSKSAGSSSDWLSALYNSQTGRVIVAEMLVAAAGAAAAVLLSERGRQGQVAMVKAGRQTANRLKKAGGKAVEAFSEGVASTAGRAGEFATAAGKTIGLSKDPSQQELAQKALEMKKDAPKPSRPDPDDIGHVH